MEENQTQSSQPARSKACKIWPSEEKSLLLQLHQQNDKVIWTQMQVIFNKNVHSSHHWTSDALVCKYKMIKPRDLVRPSGPISPSQWDVGPLPFSWMLFWLLEVTASQWWFSLEGFENQHTDQREWNWLGCLLGQPDQHGWLSQLLVRDWSKCSCNECHSDSSSCRRFTYSLL